MHFIVVKKGTLLKADWASAWYSWSSCVNNSTLKWLEGFTKSLRSGKKRPLTTVCQCKWESTFSKCIKALFPTHENLLENVRHIFSFWQFYKTQDLVSSNLEKVIFPPRTGSFLIFSWIFSELAEAFRPWKGLQGSSHNEQEEWNGQSLSRESVLQKIGG